MSYEDEIKALRKNTNEYRKTIKTYTTNGGEVSHNALKGTTASVGVNAVEGTKQIGANLGAFAKTDVTKYSQKNLDTRYAYDAVKNGWDYDTLVKNLKEKYGAKYYFGDARTDEENHMLASALYKKRAGIKDMADWNARMEQYDAKLSSIENTRKEKTQKSQEKLQAVDDKYELGKVGEFAQDVGAGLGGMLPSLAVGVVNPMAGLATMAVGAGAQSYGEALDEGASHEDATRYGVAEGVKEAAIERLTGGLSRFYGKGLIGNAVKNDSIRNVVTNTAKGMAGEGFEEGLSTALDPYLQRATYKPQAENATMGDIGYSALLGGTIGGLLGGAGHAMSFAQQKAVSRGGTDEGTETSVEYQLNGKRRPIEEVAQEARQAVQAKNNNVNMPQNTQNGVQNATEMQRGVTVPKGVNDAQNGAKYSIKKSAEGETFVDIDKDVLAGKDLTDDKEIASTIADIIKNKFDNGISANGQIIGINLKTNKEWRHSRNAKKLYNSNKTAYYDKMRAMNNADELLQASDNYVNEKAKHERKDAFIDFARGKVNFKYGDNGYFADVVVGIKQNGGADLYDVVNIKPKKITDALMTASNANAFLSRSQAPIDNTVSQNDMGVKEGKPLSKEDIMTRVSAEERDFVERASYKLGVAVAYEDMPANVNAYIANGVMHINVNRIGEGTKRVVAHELYHVIEGTKEGKKIYQLALADSGMEESALLQAKKAAYAKNGEVLDDVGAKAEIGAEYIEKAMTDEATIQRVLLESPDLAQRIWQKIKDMIEIFRLKRNRSDAEAQELWRLIQARGLYEQGLRKVESGVYGVENGVGRYKIAKDSDGNNVVILDNNIMINRPLKMSKKEYVKKYLVGLAKENPNVFAKIAENGHKVYLEDTVFPSEYTYSNASKNAKGDIKQVRENMLGVLDEIIESGQNKRFEGNKKSDKQKRLQVAKRGGMYKYNIKLAMPNDNGYNFYTAELILRRDQDNRIYPYDIVQIKIDGSPTTLLTANNDSFGMYEGVPSNSNIPQNENSVKRNSFAKDEQSQIGRDRWQESIDQYGAMDKGMQPRVEVEVPRQTNDINKTRSFTRTAMESDNLSEAVKEGIKAEATADIDSGRWTYTPESNESLQRKANDRIANNGYANEVATIKTKLKHGEWLKAEDIATAEQLAVKANDDGRYEDAMDLIGILAMVGTEQGRSVQALSMLKRMTPEGRLRMMENMKNRINAQYHLPEGEGVKVDEKLAKMLLGSTTEGGMETVQAKIVENFAKQLPSTVKDKFDAWRYLAMLGNPRTHIRNIVGNGLHLAVRRLNDELAGAVESVVLGGKSLPKGNGGTQSEAGDSLPTMRRTKTVGKTDKKLKQWAEKEWESFGKKACSNGSKYNDMGQLEQEKPIFKTKALEKVSKFNSALLEGEDTFFKKKEYIYALARYMQGNGLTGEFMENSKVARDKARSYAVEQAQIATFQEYNALASALSRFENKRVDGKGEKVHGLEKGAQIAVGALMPFKKTPLNILKRGVEYSPIGLAKGIKEMAVDVKKGKVSATEAINAMTQGLTGTGIVALGYFLGEMGMLITGYDKEESREQNYENQLGAQNYALKLGDGTYTLDWAAPVVMPLFVGAQLQKEWESRGDGLTMAKVFPTISKAAIKITDPVLEMSCMEGLQSAITSYGQGSGLSDVMVNFTKSYLGQFVPTLGGQVARTMDETKRSTYAPTDSPYTKTGESFARQMLNKVPLLSTKNEESLDVWGRTRTQEGGNALGRAVLNMASPGSYATNKETYVDKEIKRLYEATGEQGTIPKSADKYFTYDNQAYYLTAKEYTAYQKQYGKANYDALKKLVGSGVYKELSDAQKAEAIGDIYQYNNCAAKEKALEARGVAYSNATYESTRKNLAKAGNWSNYLGVKYAFPEANYDYDTAVEAKAVCDRYGFEYATYAQCKSAISSYNLKATLPEGTSQSVQTEANRRLVCEYLAKRKDLTELQKQVLWESRYSGKNSPTFAQIKRKYRL